MSRGARRAALALVLATTAGCTTAPDDDRDGESSAAPLRVDVVAGGLEHPWDIGFLPDGRVLVTERPGRLAVLSSASPGARRAPVRVDLAAVAAEGEGGLLGLVVHPDFARTRLFTTCQNHRAADGALDVRLVSWRLATDARSAARVRTLLAGLPAGQGGRHSGCRPTVAPDGSLVVGTGDAAQPSPPQDLDSLGGKVLRLDLRTGAPHPSNPHASSPGLRRYVWTYGHRNVQGVAAQPGTGWMFSVEHGPSSDDEVNLLRAGANYGWDPSRGGTSAEYDESVPMTDRSRFPDAVEPTWSSGEETQATSGATFLAAPRWGAQRGVLAVGTLKASGLLLMRVDGAGVVRSVDVPRELDGTHGRLRAARTGPDGALYLTTDNGTDDKVLRVAPR